MKVHYSGGVRDVAPGMRWRDRMTGSEWEVVELTGDRIYSPSGFGGTPNFWCRPLGEVPAQWRDQGRNDGCIAFCGDSIASMLIGDPA